MARRACRVDDNQSEVVAYLRELGYSVTPTHMVGNGFPDLAVGRGGVTWLVEVKDGGKKPSAQKLTDDERNWHLLWRGRAIIGNSGPDIVGQLEAGWRRIVQDQIELLDDRAVAKSSLSQLSDEDLAELQSVISEIMEERLPW